MEGRIRALAVIAILQTIIFVVSLPGFGIETRSPSQYAAWAGPLFLALTLLVLLSGIAAVVALRRQQSLGAKLAVAQALFALATNILDISHVGGPPPPAGPLGLGIISIVVSLAAMYFAFRFFRAPSVPLSH